MTFEKMWCMLAPVVWMHSTAEYLIKSGMIDKESREICNQIKLVVGIEKRVAVGNAESIKLLASWCRSGSYGFNKEDEKSRKF